MKADLRNEVGWSVDTSVAQCEGMKRSKRRLQVLFSGAMLIFLSALCCLVLPVSSQASPPLTVTSTADSGAGTLRQAIADATNGATIDFNLTYPAMITLTSGELLIDKNLAINGPGASILTISGNNASRVFNVSGGVTASISGLTIANGLANAGASNSCSGGGCVANAGSGGSGGGIYNAGTLTVSNCTISGNHTGAGSSASCSGGGCVANAGSGGSGGGIYNAGTLTVSNCTISGNHTGAGGSASCSGDCGGSVANAGSGGSGGGSYNASGMESSGTLTVINCTISGNDTGAGGSASGASVNNSGSGGIVGGIFNASGMESGGTLSMTNCTISGNSGGGILNEAGMGGSGTLTVKSSILSTNIGGNCYHSFLTGTITDGGYNIDSANTCGFTATGSVHDTDPKLDTGGLKDNGGPTYTIALQSSSPAIDTIASGTNGCGTTITTDQRGTSRPQGAKCDIGAYEYVPSSTTVNLPNSITLTAPSLSSCTDSSTTPSSQPNGYTLINTYNITCTSTAGTITVTIPYNPSSVPSGKEGTLQIFHWSGSSWVNVTTSIDTGAHTVTGQVTSLSPFGIGYASSSGGGSGGGSGGSGGGVVHGTGANENMIALIAILAISAGVFILRKKRWLRKA